MTWGATAATLLVAAVALAGIPLLPDSTETASVARPVEPTAATSEEPDPVHIRITNDHLYEWDRNVSFTLSRTLDEAWLSLALQPHEGSPGCTGLTPSIDLRLPNGEVRRIQGMPVTTTVSSTTCGVMFDERVRAPAGVWRAHFQGKGAIVGLVTLEEIR